MNLSIVLIISGLLLNTLASIVLLFSYLNIEKDFRDDKIVSMDEKTGKSIQIKDLKNFRISVIGLILFIFGFVFQIIGIFVQIYR